MSALTRSTLARGTAATAFLIALKEDRGFQRRRQWWQWRKEGQGRLRFESGVGRDEDKPQFWVSMTILPDIVQS